MQALLDHPWPGNIRELDHAVERGVLMAERADDPRRRSRAARRTRPGLADRGHEPRRGRGLPDRKAMARHDGNVSQAAKALGLSRSALYRTAAALRPVEQLAVGIYN